MELLGLIYLLQATAAQPPQLAAREQERFQGTVTHYQTELHSLMNQMDL